MCDAGDDCDDGSAHPDLFGPHQKIFFFFEKRGKFVSVTGVTSVIVDLSSTFCGRILWPTRGLGTWRHPREPSAKQMTPRMALVLILLRNSNAASISVSGKQLHVNTNCLEERSQTLKIGRQMSGSFRQKSN